MKPRALLLLGSLGLVVPLRGADTAPAATSSAPAVPTAPAPVTTAPTAAAANAPKPPPLSPRFQQVRNRIEALFAHRLSAPTPLDPRHNPFRPAGAFVGPVVAAGDGRTAAATEPQPADLTVLQQAVATLKVGGRFVSAGREHRMVNARLYKEGDVIPTQLQGQPVYLRVKALNQKSLTLSLGDSELTLTLDGAPR
jgi:hypothetical protein